MYNKLFTKILDSSIWLENQPTRLVWITFLACMNQDGIVQLSSIGNVANRARVSEKEAEEAINILESPDEHNPDQDFEGRRIERIPGVGWFVINAEKYRDIIKAETARAKTRERVREYRERKAAGNAGVTVGNDSVTPSDSDSSTGTKKEEKKTAADAARSGKKSSSPPTDHQRLMQHHSDRIGTVMDGAKQGAHIKKILANFTVDQAVRCYDSCVADTWRTKVDWATVSSYIAEWVTRGEPKKPKKVQSNGYDPKKDMMSPEWEFEGEVHDDFESVANVFFDHHWDGTKANYEEMKQNWSSRKGYEKYLHEIEDYERGYKFRQRYSEAR